MRRYLSSVSFFLAHNSVTSKPLNTSSSFCLVTFVSDLCGLAVSSLSFSTFCVCAYTLCFRHSLSLFALFDNAGLAQWNWKGARHWSLPSFSPSFIFSSPSFSHPSFLSCFFASSLFLAPFHSHPCFFMCFPKALAPNSLDPSLGSMSAVCSFIPFRPLAAPYPVSLSLCSFVLIASLPCRFMSCTPPVTPHHLFRAVLLSPRATLHPYLGLSVG